ncbi:hypothetical protein MMC25_007114 [Agyrium rufum]|nr:hypothetical protein [Agyrium rufum]
MSTQQTILVAGATGKQGKGVISALLALNDPSIKILALTRNTYSATAQRIVSQAPSQIQLIGGDLDAPEKIFAAAPEPITAVYSVQLAIDPSNTPEHEIQQGKALVDAALAAGTVKHFVYASADQGPPEDEETSDVQHNKTKLVIEAYLKQKSAGTNMTWTILRPVAFFDNFGTNVGGKVGFAATKYFVRPERRLKYVATADIGWFAAQSFSDPQKWNGRTVEIAGDEMSWSELETTFRRKTNMAPPMPWGWWLLPWFILNVVMKDLGRLYRRNDRLGFHASVEETRKMHPNALNFERWLETTSFVKKDA